MCRHLIISNIISLILYTNFYYHMTGIGNGVGNHIYGADEATVSNLSSVVKPSNVDEVEHRHSSKTSKETNPSSDIDIPEDEDNIVSVVCA